MDLNRENIERLWNKDSYYKLIENSQGEGGEFFLNKIAELVKKNSSQRVLDVGCGEGSVVGGLMTKGLVKLDCKGIDVAEIGIERAKSKNLNCEFRVYDGTTIPFEDEAFDLSFSTFVFEHLLSPEKLFLEMSRVTKKGGIILIICPNYGSPFFRSPCNKENKTKLMFKRLFQSLLPSSKFTDKFLWNQVEPLMTKEDAHIMDHDTTIEPNLLFFKKFISRKNFEIQELNSFWDRFQYSGNSKLKKFFLNTIAFFGRLNFPGIRFYGPFFYAAIIKK